MPENLKEILKIMFSFADWQPEFPKDEKFFKKKDWFREYTWTEKSQERAIELIADKLKKDWKWVVSIKPTSNKMRKKMARDFVYCYWFITRPLTIKDFTPLVPVWQIESVMSKNEYDKWSKWAMWNTRSLHWVYKWDLESFLNWSKNWD